MTTLTRELATRSHRMLSVRRSAIAALLVVGVAGCSGKLDVPAARESAAINPAAPMTADPDTRTALVLPAQGRHMVLEEMRGMLISVEGYVAAAAKGDTAGMRAAAQASGVASARDMDPAIEDRLPAEFVRLGMSTHSAWDSLAVDVGRGAPPNQTLGRLGDIMKNCVACHAQYRIEVPR
ncbi:MAG: hypothetical protein ABI120_24200 [Gemmatimonadaceae bacterium]